MSDNWETPEHILEPLKEEFGDFFDPCPLNAKFNGLEIEWGDPVFINPPYSRKLKKQFIEEAYNRWKKDNKTIVMLLPVSTSSKTFHEFILPHCEIRFVKGRIKFKGYNNNGDLIKDKDAMHDSMICIFHKRTE